jgi:hypothetical protein
MAGKFADGTAFSFSPALVQDEQGRRQLIAFYRAADFSERLAGAITFEALATSDCNGIVSWIRSKARSPYYPGEIESSLAVTGARYTAPKAGERAVAITDGVVELSGGSLSVPIAEQVTLSTANKVTVLGLNEKKVVLTISAATGVLTGSFVHPVTGKPVNFSGSLYQSPAAPQGAGYFRGPVIGGSGKIGKVTLLPAP